MFPRRLFHQPHKIPTSVYIFECQSTPKLGFIHTSSNPPEEKSGKRYGHCRSGGCDAGGVRERLALDE